MNIKKINWNYVSDPKCENGEIVVLIQHKEAEIAKYVSPKPEGSPVEGGNFIFEVCDNEDDLEKEIYMTISKQFPEVEEEPDSPFLFLCPDEFAKKAIWN